MQLNLIVKMKSKILNKLTKEGREKVIQMEGRLRELDLELEEIDEKFDSMDSEMPTL